MPESDEAKAARHRSPNYPGFSLKVAVARINSWYQQDGWVASYQSAALAHMGFEKLTGDAGRLLSALKSYGLIQEADGRLKLSQRAIDIVARDLDDPKRAQALKAAALGPAIYKDLLKDYPYGKVSDGTLKSELIAARRFNPKSVDEFIRDFRSTLEFSGLSDSESLESDQDRSFDGDNPVSVIRVGDFVQWTSQGIWQFQEPRRVTGFTNGGDLAYIEGSKGAVPVNQLSVEAPPKQAEVSSARPFTQTQDQPSAPNLVPVKALLSHDLVVSIPRNFRLSIAVRGDELKKDDLAKIKSQFNRWIEGLEEAFD